MKISLQILALAALLSFISATPAAAQTTQSADTQAVKEALAYAPGPVMGVAHIDVAACRPAMEKMIAAMFGYHKPERRKRLLAALQKVNQTNVFIIGMKPVLVIRGSLTPKEFINTFRQDHPFRTPITRNAKPGPGEEDILSKNGLYIYRRQYCILWGNESPLLPENIMIAGFPPSLYHKVISNIGKGAEQNSKLMELLNQTNTSRQIWGAGYIPQMSPAGIFPSNMPPNAPKSVIGSANIFGKNEALDLKLIFKEPLEDDFNNEDDKAKQKKLGLDFLTFKVHGNAVIITLTQKTDASLADHFADAMTLFVRNRHRATTAANLSNIGKAFAMYEASHNDQTPKELGVLIDEGFAQQGMFICPLNPKSEEFKAYNQKNFKTYKDQKFRCDLIVLSPRKNPKDSDIRAYFNPVFYEDKNGKIETIDVLFINGSVQSMKYDEFQKKLTEQTTK